MRQYYSVQAVSPCKDFTLNPCVCMAIKFQIKMGKCANETCISVKDLIHSIILHAL